LIDLFHELVLPLVYGPFGGLFWTPVLPSRAIRPYLKSSWLHLANWLVLVCLWAWNDLWSRCIFVLKWKNEIVMDNEDGDTSDDLMCVW